MNKKIIIGSAIALTGIATYFVVKKAKKRRLEKQLQNQNKSSISDSDGQNKTIVKPVSDFPLKYGSRGENVKKVQSYLNQKMNAGLKEDGIWGDNTEKAVKAATGTNQVTESMFKQYIGAPSIVVNAGAGTGSGSGLSLNPLSRFADSVSKAINLFK